MPARGKHGTIIKQGDILISSNVSQYTVIVIRDNVKRTVVSNSIIVIRPLEKISAELLALIFNLDYVKKQVERYAYGSQIETISQKDLAEIKIPTPVSKQQIKRLEIKASEVYKEKHSIIENYSNRFKKMEQLFLKEIGLEKLKEINKEDIKYTVAPWETINSNNLDPIAYTGKAYRILSALSDFKTTKIENIASLRRGQAISKKVKSGDDFILLKNNKIPPYRMNYNDLKKISKSKKIKPIYLEQNDLVINTIGKSLGATALVENTKSQDILFDNHVCRIRLKNKSKIEPKYLLICLNSIICQSQFEAAMKGKYEQINITDIKQVKIPLISIQLQEMAVNKVYNFYNDVTESYKSFGQIKEKSIREISSILQKIK